jgi:hypothetical protein
VTNFKTVGATKQPAITTDHLRHTGVGKTGTTSDNKAAYDADTVNVS